MSTIKVVKQGDFFSTGGKGVTGWLNSKFTETRSGSHTDRFHFGIIADTVYDKGGCFVDFETRESISKGPSTLRFFDQYLGQDVELYRLVNVTVNEGIRLSRSISEIGRAGYGYRDLAECCLDVFCLMVTLQFPPYQAGQFQISKSDKYICTELPAYGAREIGYPIEPDNDPRVWVIPVVYLQAIEDGKLECYYKGNLRDLYEYHRGISCLGK